MASESIVKIENSSLEVKEIKGNGNDVSYIKLVFNFFADLPQKIKDILRKGLPEVMRKSLVAETPDDSTTLTVEGDADGLALYEHLEELAKDLEENEKKKMIHIFCLSHKVEPRPTDLQQLFESMVHVGKLRFQDFIYLQCLLWKVGRRDLFKKMAEKARELQTLHQNDQPPLRILHLDAPNLEPVNGYSYVKFHLQVDILEIDSERLRNLQMKLAKFLNVPQEFIAVVGVEPYKSAWVTVIMPTVATEALKRHFDDGGLQNFLLSLGIDKVGFFPEPLEGLTDIKSKSLTPPAPEDTETLPVEGDADDQALYEHLQELEKDLTENETKNIIDMFCSSHKVEPRPTNLRQLFESMIHMGKPGLQDIIYLQCLLWKVGREDLFKKMAEKARALKTLQIARMDSPSLDPVEGFKYVKFHLQVNILDITSKQLRNLETKLAQILAVPRDYIAVVGVEPDNTAQVTAIMPTAACEGVEPDNTAQVTAIMPTAACEGVEPDNTAQVTAIMPTAACEGVEPDNTAQVTAIMPTAACEALKRLSVDSGFDESLASLGIAEWAVLNEGQTDIKSKSLTPPAPEDTETLPVEGDADDQALYKHLQELEKDLKENETKSMIDMFCSFYEVEPRPTDLQQLFESMIHMGKLSLRNFTYLQSLLWKVGREDLFKKMAEKARALQTLHQNDKPPLRIAHLNAPYLQPVLDYSYVKFDLQVDTLHSEQLRSLRVKLAEILSVPQEYIVVVGVEMGQ